MTPFPDAVADALHDGVGTLDAAGGVVPRNAAMAALLRLAGGPRGPATTLGELGVDAAALAALHAGERVAIDVDGRHWQLSRVAGTAAGGEAWLVAHETTAVEHERSAAVELARLRALAAAAGTLVHDLNNLMNAALALTAQVRPNVADPLDLQLLVELAHGTQQGAQLARTVARLLMRTDAGRALVPTRALLDEAIAMAGKAAAQRGTQVVVELPEEPPVVRTIAAEAVQGLWHALATLVERSPQRIVIALAAVPAAIGGGRVRQCARVRIAASLPRADGEELARFAAGAPGMLQASWRAPSSVGLPLATFVLRRLGGDLVARLVGDELQLDCLLPAVT